MLKRKIEIVIHIFNAVFISAFLITYLNWNYPKIGGDYSYFIPNLLDTYLHYKINGISIQWYTPSFGGGIPSFPDPQQIQFSLPQLLTFLVNPWSATIIATIIFAVIGYFAMYYFLSHSLSLQRQTGILGGLFFTLNGFYIERMSTGHLGYQAYPLLTIILVVMFSTSLPEVISAIVIALILSVMVYEAGFYLIVIFLLSLTIALPILYLFYPQKFRFRRFIRLGIFVLIFTVLFSGSKILAVYTYMEFFPRQVADYYPVNLLSGLLGIILQLLGTMNLGPLLKLVGLNPSILPKFMVVMTGAQYGYWEFDMSMSTVVLGILIMGTYSLFRGLKKNVKTFTRDKKWIAWILLIFFIWLTIEFILAKGLMYPFLQKLPILSSLHVNPRFASAFLFPLALSAAVIYNGWAAKWSEKKSVLLFLTMIFLTLIPLSTYLLIKTDLQDRYYNVTESQEIYTLIRSGENMTVTGIVSGVNNTGALFLHQSNLQPYEPIFGYILENFHPQVVPGSIWNISDGSYNMTNPAGYVYPELNRTHPFERINVNDKNKLEAFASHRLPDWKIPVYQQVLDCASGLSFVVALIVLTWYGFQRLLGRRDGLLGHSVFSANTPDT